MIEEERNDTSICNRVFPLRIDPRRNRTGKLMIGATKKMKWEAEDDEMMDESR